MARYFKLTRVEQDREAKFRRKHSGHGMSFTYTFTFPITDFGKIIKIKCDGCRAIENITEL